MTAARGAATAADRSGWVGPHWMERQADPEGPDFLPVDRAARTPGPRNLTHRNWTAIGVLDSPWRALVDQRGMVTPGLGGWSLDWWVGAEDRWHVPGREVAVRHHAVGGSPVLETVMRVPGGDIHHRAYGAPPDADLPWPWSDAPGCCAVVEIENRSAVPVAVALAIRPVDPLGWTSVHTIGVTSGGRDGDDAVVVMVEGEPGLLVARDPAYVAASDQAGGDSAAQLWAGDAIPVADFPGIECQEGGAQAALVFPLPHTALLRAAVPLGLRGSGPSGRPTNRRRANGSDGVASEGRRPMSSVLPGLPSADRVAAGWARHGERGVRLVVPDSRMATLVDACRRSLLLAAAGEDVIGGDGDPLGLVDASLVVAALDQWGLHAEAGRLLAGLGDRQGSDGLLADPVADPPAAGTGAALWTLAHHHALGLDVGPPPTDLLPMVAAAAQGLARRVDLAGREPPGRVRRVRRVRTGPSAAELVWCAAGLRAAGTLFTVAGRADAALEVAVDQQRAEQAMAEARPGRADGPAASGRPFDLLTPFVLADPVAGQADGEPVRAGAAAALDRRGPAGYSPRATALLAAAELARETEPAAPADHPTPTGGEPGPDPLSRLWWLVAVAPGSLVWPTTVHPRTSGGSTGSGHDVTAAAAFLLLVRQLLADLTGGELRILGRFPHAWWGQAVEAHAVVTPHGSLSWAVRWHGDRPALLWELETPAPVGGGVVIRAPGLDPAWRTDQRRGETLLSRWPRPGLADPPTGPSFS